LECENAESLALCQQTAEYLRSKTGSILDCRPGGRFTRALAAALQPPAVTYLLFDTPAGRSLMNKLARLPVRDAPLPAATQEALVAELKANNNLAVTMALINRFGELKTLVAPRSPTLAKAGFTSHPEKLAPADQAIVASLAGQVITPGFISGVPAILSR
jgi:hypothetical protein